MEGEVQPFRFPLLPHKARWAGLVLFLPGLVAGYLYYFGSRPDLFESPVLAIASTYAESRFFVIARTNWLDEIFALCCIAGLAMAVFSRERHELPGMDVLRARAMIRAAYITLIFWAASFLFIFGWAILAITASLFVLFLLIYYAGFRIMLHTSRIRRSL